MDPFRFLLGFGPLAVYLVFIGVINLLRRPVILSGWQDTLAMALGLAGLMVVGPLNLFFPVAAFLRFGPWVWVFLLALYGLIVVLVLFWARPRLVIYNIGYTDLRPLVSETAVSLDEDARWAGESLFLPNLGVQLHLEYSALMKNALLVAVGSRQDPEGWKQLEGELRLQLAKVRSSRNWSGLALVAMGSLLALGGILGVLGSPEIVAESFRELIFR